MNVRPRIEYVCIRSPKRWDGQSFFKLRHTYIIHTDDPGFIWYLLPNGSLGHKYSTDNIPKPFEKYFEVRKS